MTTEAITKHWYAHCAQATVLSLNPVVHTQERALLLLLWEPLVQTGTVWLGTSLTAPGAQRFSQAALVQGAVFGTLREGREKVGNSFQSRKKHPLLLRSTNL